MREKMTLQISFNLVPLKHENLENKTEFLETKNFQMIFDWN